MSDMDTAREQAAPAPAPAPRNRRPLLIAGIVAGAIGIFALGLLAGHGPRGGEFGPRGDRAWGGEHMRDGGGPGYGGRHGGGMGGGKHPGEGRHGGMGLGTVTSVTSSKLEVAPVHGPREERSYTLSSDTEVYTRGDAGPRDLEQAQRSDITKGAIVAVEGDADAARSVVILGREA